MVLNIDSKDQASIDELLEASQKNDVTLSFLLINMWINSFGALLLFALFYFCCTVYRRDKERFILKMHKMS